MSKKKTYKNNSTKQKAEEPSSSYNRGEIKIFHSFEEQEEYQLQKMSNRTYKERLDHLELLRKFFLREYLLPDGNWAPIEKIITIQKPKIG